MSVVARTTVAISRRRSGIDVGNLKTVKRGERVEHEKFSGYRDLRSMIVARRLTIYDFLFEFCFRIIILYTVFFFSFLFWDI